VHTCLKAIMESQRKKANKEIESSFQKKIEEFNTAVSTF
jgi:hypothetical protein